MVSFLFEQYGYYPQDIIDNEFKIGDWKFKLFEVDYEEIKLNDFEKYLEVIRSQFDGRGAFIIKNREGRFVSLYDNKKYCLVSVCEFDATMKDLNKLHCSLMDNEKNENLSDLLETWKDRIDFIENNAISSLRVDSVYYINNLEIVLFCLGMAQNSVQYLSEIIIDYGNSLENLCVCHKRLKNLNSFDVFNPFNMIVDHPVRDLCELYRNNYLSFFETTKALNYYNIDNKIASLFMARLLYPTIIFDLLQEFVYKKTCSEKLIYNIEQELEKTKKIYLYLRTEYNIRPILWLEN